jgi:multidrug efflux system outer membrane protein
MRRAIVLLLIVGFVPGFALAQKKGYQPPTVQTPTQYRADPRPQPDPQTLADTKWFDVFKDQKLQDLIHEALLHNYDLRESVARIDLARASVGITKSQQYPQIYGSATWLPSAGPETAS